MDQQQADGLNPCRCGCGTQVAGVWARGHSARGVGGYVAPLGADEEDLPPIPFGSPVIDVGDLPAPPAPGSSGHGPPSPPDGPGPDGADRPPRHSTREWRQRPRKRPGPKALPRITVGVRTDIEAKIAFGLQIPGMWWQARDQVCGGTFVQQIPDTAEALADIVCDSPDLVAFFTGPGGGFMKYLKLGAAVMPVAQAAMAHHVYHSVEAGPPVEQDPYVRYAA